ncbi:MAG: DUF1792 domain-containing protein [Clostridia bacterium]|nr:DUF1792 domain-containing protein [Clostridia bacterium]
MEGIVSNKLKVMNTSDTLDYILEHNCSIARYGDGELTIIDGGYLHFQSSNPELGERLKNVKTTENCLVCIPDAFGGNLDREVLTKLEVDFWEDNVSKNKEKWENLFSECSVLGDAFISRFYLRYLDRDVATQNLNKLRQLWDGRDIVFVEGKNSRLGMGNDLFFNAKSIRRILCPLKDAFDRYEDIKASILKNCKKGDLIIVALGPTATVLAHDLSDSGLQLLDLGHIDIEYEWYLSGTKKKTPVKNKFVNEARTADDCEDGDVDEKYLSEIIDRVY